MTPKKRTLREFASKEKEEEKEKEEAEKRRDEFIKKSLSISSALSF